MKLGSLRWFKRTRFRIREIRGLEVVGTRALWDRAWIVGSSLGLMLSVNSVASEVQVTKASCRTVLKSPVTRRLQTNRTHLSASYAPEVREKTDNESARQRCLRRLRQVEPYLDGVEILHSQDEPDSDGFTQTYHFRPRVQGRLGMEWGHLKFEVRGKKARFKVFILSDRHRGRGIYTMLLNEFFARHPYVEEIQSDLRNTNLDGFLNRLASVEGSSSLRVSEIFSQATAEGSFEFLNQNPSQIRGLTRALLEAYFAGTPSYAVLSKQGFQFLHQFLFNVQTQNLQVRLTRRNPSKKPTFDFYLQLGNSGEETSWRVDFDSGAVVPSQSVQNHFSF